MQDSCNTYHTLQTILYTSSILHVLISFNSQFPGDLVSADSLIPYNLPLAVPEENLWNYWKQVFMKQMSFKIKEMEATQDN